MNTRMKQVGVALLMTLGFSAISNANTYTVYKTIGAHGEVKFTQMQPNVGVQYETIQFRSDGRTNTAGQMAAPTVDPAVAAEQQRTADMQKQIEELQAREKADRCNRLRSNLSNLNMGGRIYETTNTGERVFLNDQEIQSRRTSVQQTIAQHCT